MCLVIGQPNGPLASKLNIWADLSQFFSILSDCKCYRAPSQALQIIFEMQKQRTSKKKEQSRKYDFFICKTCWLLFFFILNSLTFKPHNYFLFLIHFKRFKVLQEHHLKFYKSPINSNSNIATYKECFESSRIGLCRVQCFVFKVFDPLQFGGGGVVPNFVWTPKTMEPSPWIRPTLSS